MSSAGWLIERFGAARILVPAFLLGAVATALVGYAAASVPAMATELFLIGLFVGMGGSGAIALAALTYPTAIRSTGVGWAMAMGRFGQVIAPLCAGLAVKGGWSNIQLFVVLAIAPVLGALAIFALRAVPAQTGATEEVAAASPLAS